MTQGDAVKKWFLSREPRERLMMLAAGMLVILWLGWQFILQPLNEARNLSVVRVQAAEQSLTRVQEMASTLEVLRQDTPLPDRSLVQRVNDAAQGHDLALTALEPSSDNRSVVVRLDGVAPGVLFAWLASIENEAGMWVDSLMITPDSAADRVSANARVRQ